MWPARREPVEPRRREQPPRREFEVRGKLDRRYIIACHEAAHALAAIMTGREMLGSVSLDSDGGGTFTSRDFKRVHTDEEQAAISSSLCETLHESDYDFALKRAVVMLAGEAAQIRLGDDPEAVRVGALIDCEHAWGLAKAVTDNDCDAERFMHKARRDAAEIARWSWPQIERLAEALLARGRLNGRQIYEAIGFPPGFKPRTPDDPQRQTPTPTPAVATSAPVAAATPQTIVRFREGDAPYYRRPGYFIV